MRGKQIFLSKSAAQTQRLSRELVKSLLRKKDSKSAKILALVGELGSGKTTFVQGLARALGIKSRVTSPSFVIMRRYQLSNCPIEQLNNYNFYHIDCYRLRKAEELLSLDFKDIIKNPRNLVAVEWADKVKSLIPRNAVWVEFRWAGERERKIEIKTSVV